jgi:hypothetical protein
MQRTIFVITTAVLISFFSVYHVKAQPKSALIIVVEENTTQGESVSWLGIHEALQSYSLVKQLPEEVRNAIQIVQNAVSQIIGQTDLDEYIQGQLRRQFAEALKVMIYNIRQQFGLPGSGCISGMLETLATEQLTVGEDIYKVFLDYYGEPGLSNCLKEISEPYYDHVKVLTDADASFENFKYQLFKLEARGYVIDILLDVHGCGENISLNNGSCGDKGLCFYKTSDPAHSDRIDTAKIKQLKKDNNHKPFNINAVYMVGCWGSEFNQAWIDIGAKASNGANQLNYYVLLSPAIFLDAFTRGEKTLKEASRFAYDIERALLNGVTFRVNLDLRPELNRLVPINYANPSPCGVEIMGQWFGLATKIDHFGHRDKCVGNVAGQDFTLDRGCPPAYSLVARRGSDRCKQDLLGDFRNAAHWNFELGISYGNLVDIALAQKYGADANQPVDNDASSSRRHDSVGGPVRQGGICREDALFYCFGAVGMFCGGIPNMPNGEIWGCAGSECVINAGSIKHDECCFSNQSTGTMCGVAIGTQCNEEWNKAIHRTIHRLSWKRRINTCEINNTGTVDLESYCAPNGTVVAQDDSQFCCSGTVRRLNPRNPADRMIILKQNVFLDGSFRPVVCTKQGR